MKTKIRGILAILSVLLLGVAPLCLIAEASDSQPVASGQTQAPAGTSSETLQNANQNQQSVVAVQNAVEHSAASIRIASAGMTPDNKLKESDVNVAMANRMFTDTTSDGNIEVCKTSTGIHIDAGQITSATTASAGVSYSDFTGGITLAGNIVVGLSGDINASAGNYVTVTVSDIFGKQAATILDGIEKNHEDFWSIPVSSLTGIDTTRIGSIQFSIKGPKISGTYLDVRLKNLPWASDILASDKLKVKDINLPGSDHYYHVSSPNDVTKVTAIEGGINISYSQGQMIWSGSGGFIYDVPQDFSHLKNITVGLQGYNTGCSSGNRVSDVNIIITDAKYNIAVIRLDNVNRYNESIFQIPISRLSRLDLTKIVKVEFGTAGSGYNSTGSNMNVYVRSGAADEDAAVVKPKHQALGPVNPRIGGNLGADPDKKDLF